MLRPPPIAPLTTTLVPYPTLFRALGDGPPAAAVGLDDRVVDVAVVLLEPAHERGPDVERQVLEGVDEDVAVGGGELHGGVGAVALGCDALVPVVERRSRRLLGHLAGPGVLPGRWVEVRSEEHTSELPSLMRHSYAVI